MRQREPLSRRAPRAARPGRLDHDVVSDGASAGQDDRTGGACEGSGCVAAAAPRLAYLNRLSTTASAVLPYACTASQPTCLLKVERWFAMKRFFVVTIAAFALLVPTLTFAQVTTVYIPGAHPRVVVVPPTQDRPAAKVEKAPLTPVQVIALHEPMAAAYRGGARVNYSAVAHCDRLVAEARAALRKNF